MLKVSQQIYQAMREHALVSPPEERQMHAPTPLTGGSESTRPVIHATLSGWIGSTTAPTVSSDSVTSGACTVRNITASRSP